FLLFFALTEPDDIARRALGDKVTYDVIEQWKESHGYDKPKWPSVDQPIDNMLVDHFSRMLTFDFGRGAADFPPLSPRRLAGRGPRSSLCVRMFFVSLIVSIVIALFVAFFRGTYLHPAGVFSCVLALCIPILPYIIGGQYL